jgi:hypothetical protein
MWGSRSWLQPAVSRLFKGAAILLCGVAHATVVPRLSLEQLIKSADKIVQGKVVRTWTAWDSTHEFIWTHYQLTVTDRLKGPATPTVVSEPGGSLAGQNIAIQGTPRLQLNEELIVFLYRTPIGYWRNVGYGQGCYRVSAGRIQSGLSGIELSQASFTGTPLDSLNRLTTAEFKHRVRALIVQQNHHEATR